VQLFESHEKNLFLVDKKYWICETCKTAYAGEQTTKHTAAQQKLGFPELQGTPKQIIWALKIRAELINKVDYLKNSLTFENDDEKKQSETAFNLFLNQWQQETSAKWWVDHRKMTVRDISNGIDKFMK